MSNDVVIAVEGISKKFCRSLKRSMIYGVKDIALDVLGIHRTSNGLRPDEFWALNDVSFEVKRGECLGLIGPNGAGKSTLLKMLNGLILPDKGTIKVRGHMGALLELGAGFHPMLTGRENIYLSGAILGLSKKQIDKRFNEIVVFAELEEFLDSPVKFYSSGMYARLGFAVAVHAHPDILAVDEALAVGDVRFQLRCITKMKELISRGTSVLFVTHDIYAVKNFCRRALWLHEGKQRMHGDAFLVTDAYSTFMQNGTAATQSENVTKNVPKSPLTITDARILDGSHQAKDVFGFGETIIVEIHYEVHESIRESIVAGVAVFDNNKNYVCGLNTKLDEVCISGQGGQHTLCLEYKRIRLLPGTYHIDLGFFEGSAIVVLDYKPRFRSFTIESNKYKAEGIFLMDHIWRT